MTDPVPWAGSSRSRALAWSLAGASGLGFVGLVVLELRRGDPSAASSIAGGVLTTVLFVALGTVLALRQPGNPIGWLLTAGGLAWFGGGVARSIARYALQPAGRASATARLAAGFDDRIWVLGVLCSVGLPLLLFPAGRTRSREWQWVLRTMVAGGLLTLLGGLVSTDPVPSPVRRSAPLTNPLAVEQLAPIASYVGAVGVLLMVVTMVAAVGGIIARFRSVSGVQRQQLRWVRVGAVLALGGNLSVPIGARLGWPSQVFDVLQPLGTGCLPLAFTVAILRYRLYDLDRIVSRTVTYTAVTGLLVGTYVATVTAVSRLTPSGSSLAVATSTLAVAALFQPLRRRMQHSVDRRFNRARVDAERTVASFSRKLREQVDLDVVRTELLTVVHQTMQPVSADLWLRGVHRVST